MIAFASMSGLVLLLVLLVTVRTLQKRLDVARRALNYHEARLDDLERRLSVEPGRSGDVTAGA